MRGSFRPIRRMRWLPVSATGRCLRCRSRRQTDSEAWLARDATTERASGNARRPGDHDAIRAVTAGAEARMRWLQVSATIRRLSDRRLRLGNARGAPTSFDRRARSPRRFPSSDRPETRRTRHDEDRSVQVKAIPCGNGKGDRVGSAPGRGCVASPVPMMTRATSPSSA